MNVLLVDALGTLLALDDPAPRLQAELTRRFRVAVSQASARGAIAAEIAYYRAHFDEGRDLAALADLRGRCAEALRSGLPADGRLSAVGTGDLTDALLASLQFTAFEDAAPALARARERGQRVVVVSNWDVSLEDVLSRVGLTPFLDAVVTSASVGVRKPGAEIFERALVLSGAEADDAVHVGDSVEDDVVGARAVGIEPVLIRRDGGEGPPGVRTIATLAAL
jgi:putative hydrolase of the HAD superfamily